jgi:hypothetical protein
MTEKLGKTLQLLLVLAVIFGSHYLMPIKNIDRSAPQLPRPDPGWGAA